MMPFAPRQKNLYLVHGWKVTSEIRNSMMMEKGVEAMALGITLTMAMSGKASFIGRHLGTVDIRDGEEYAGITIPDPDQQKSLVEIAKKLELAVTGPPILYVIEG
jgi:hypothetical protein